MLVPWGLPLSPTTPRLNVSVFRKYEIYSHMTRNTYILSSEEIFSEEKLRFYSLYYEYTGGSFRSGIKRKFSRL